MANVSRRNSRRVMASVQSDNCYIFVAVYSGFALCLAMKHALLDRILGGDRREFKKLMLQIMTLRHLYAISAVCALEMNVPILSALEKISKFSITSARHPANQF